MFAQILIACVLVALTVAVHAVGLDLLLRAMTRAHILDRSGFRLITGMVVGLTCWLILIHLVEIAVWGMFYFFQGCLPDVESAFYFSAVTYTTLGDGSLTLPKAWRIFAPLEALTAILMCGLSTGLFFAVVTHWINNWMKVKAPPDHETAASTLS